MTLDRISITDVAVQCGKRKPTVFKVLKRLRIEPVKLKSPERHGQIASYITQSEFELVRAEIEGMQEATSIPPDFLPSELGVFYIIQLEPGHDPTRFKLGFATNMSERLRSHKTAAPFATVINTWPCRSLWEKTAIDCVADGCERLHTEVFRAESLDDVVERCNDFFSLMPKLTSDDEPK